MGGVARTAASYGGAGARWDRGRALGTHTGPLADSASGRELPGRDEWADEMVLTSVAEDRDAGDEVAGQRDRWYVVWGGDGCTGGWVCRGNCCLGLGALLRLGGRGGRLDREADMWVGEDSAGMRGALKGGRREGYLYAVAACATEADARAERSGIQRAQHRADHPGALDSTRPRHPWRWLAQRTCCRAVLVADGCLARQTVYSGCEVLALPRTAD